MSHPDVTGHISRRRVLTLGGGVAAGSLLSAAPLSAVAQARSARVQTQAGKLPAAQIQKIMQAQGTVTNGVLSIDITRSDIGKSKGPLGVTQTGSFEINGTLTFQPLGHNLAFFNGDLPLKPSETQRFIDALIANGLAFQALHQHYIELDPQVWFIHFRGTGDPLELARAVHNALKVTSTQLPQTMPSNPKSPLDSKRLAKILRGSAQIGEDGVVTVNVSRRGRIVIDGVRLSPEANISTGIEFKPLGESGSRAAAAPDFSMSGSEVQSVVTVMRRQGWFVGCLYNQETSESPQLYFAHMLKTGDAYTLAAEIRAGLDKTHAD
jgi:hypothetical protein